MLLPGRGLEGEDLFNRAPVQSHRSPQVIEAQLLIGVPVFRCGEFAAVLENNEEIGGGRPRQQEKAQGNDDFHPALHK